MAFFSISHVAVITVAAGLALSFDVIRQPRVAMAAVPAAEANARTPIALDEIPTLRRFVSLKSDSTIKTYTGPGDFYPSAWEYSQQGLPLLAEKEQGDWTYVRDIDGDYSWVHQDNLSDRRTVISFEAVSLHKKPRESSRIVVNADKNVVFKLGECHMNGWCQVRTPSGKKGWSPQYKYWGVATPN